MARSKFEQIYRDVKNKIESELYPRGELLPSEYQLIEEYDCSRNTVRRALGMLAADGYVQAIHGKGVQNIYHPMQKAEFTFAGIETFRETAKRNHFQYETKVIQFTDIIVDERIGNRTGYEPGTEVFYVQRIRSINGVNVIFDINVFLKSEMPELTAAIAAQSVYSYLEQDLGMQIVTSNRQITSERATEADEKYLDLEDYDFLSVITSQTFNSKGIMFEWTESRHRPDYFTFRDTAVRNSRK